VAAGVWPSRRRVCESSVKRRRPTGVGGGQRERERERERERKRERVHSGLSSDVARNFDYAQPRRSKRAHGVSREPFRPPPESFSSRRPEKFAVRCTAKRLPEADDP